MVKKKNWVICICGVFLVLFILLNIPITTHAEGDLYLTEIQERWTGYSVLKDTIGIDTAHSGDPIIIGGVQYDHGLGMHCMAQDPTYLDIDISGLGYKTFCAEVGVLSEGSAFLDWAEASFSVIVDGVEKAKSAVKKYKDGAEFIAVDISGASTLRLQISNEGTHSCDWCAWANARLTNKSVEELQREQEAKATPTPEVTPAPTQNPDIINQDKVYISDMEWIGFKALQDLATRDTNLHDEELFVYGKYFEKGVCLHGMTGGSYIELDITDLGFKTFVAEVGIPESLDSDLTMGTVRFIVYADGQEVKRTDVMTLTSHDEPELITVDVTGVKILKLVVDPTADTFAGDWGAWGNALLARSDNLEEILATPKPTQTPEPTPTLKPTEAPKVTETPNVTEAPDESKDGCGSSSAIAQVLMLLGAALIIKKKK